MNNPNFQDASIRNAKLAAISQESAFLALNKAKSLVMAYWHGETIATTISVASFYEVSEKTIKSLVDRHREEFVSDGLRLVAGSDIRDVSRILRLTPTPPRANIWTPRAILRAGMLLQDSPTAKQVRNVVLDQVGQNPNPQQLGLLDDEEEAPRQPTTSISTPAEIAEMMNTLLGSANVSRRVIALATAEAIAQQHPALKTTMSIAQKYLKP
jgi:hypothetical protein